MSDDSIQDAQKALWKLLRVVAEPGGAAALCSTFCRDATSPSWESEGRRPDMRWQYHCGLVSIYRSCVGRTLLSAAFDLDFGF